MRPNIPKYDAILLANHGAVAYGSDVMRAFFRMDTVEHFARIALAAELLGAIYDDRPFRYDRGPFPERR